MQYGCASGSDTQCPNIIEPVMLDAICDDEVDEFRNYYDSGGNGQDGFYDFFVPSSAFEWQGSCREGSCKVCAEGAAMQCNHNGQAGAQSHTRYCVNGEWSYQSSSHISQSSAEAFLIAACTLLGCCFLALLGVIAAIVMLK